MEFQTSGDCVWKKNLPLFFGGSCVYRFTETVIYLVTSPTIKKSEKFGVNFHNCYGSCMLSSYFS